MILTLLFLLAQSFDLVITGGRVMDPESGLDAVRHVGIRAGKIAAISEQPLQGAAVINAAGRVVAPGFIDLHAHGQSAESNEYQAHDGVTTALELEGGVASVAKFVELRRGRALVNFGASASHGGLRARAMQEPAAGVELDLTTRSRYRPLTQFNELARQLEGGLREGALGIGMAHQYYPGASREEIFRVFQMAVGWNVPIFVHVRSMTVDAMQEVIANAAATGASLHIVHVNSMSLGEISLVLDLIAAARGRGLDITTEAYPYTAASTFLQSAIFDSGWQDRLGISYGDLQWQDTGERLTQETFERYRAKGGVVIMHMMKPEWIEKAMATPFVMVASDGMPFAPGAHPRSAGTFSRVLGFYARERKALTLMDALRKMTLMPAERLEKIAPQMRHKGRLREGADADVVVFDPETVKDMATFEQGLKFSQGIEQVIVNGVAVVRDGKTVTGVFPGQAVVGNYAR
jgi:dihydroorotase